MKDKILYFLVGSSVVTAFVAATVFGSHSWNGYHWARTANSFTLKLGDNVSSVWDSYLAVASADWSISTMLDTAIVSGRSNPKNCRPTSGRVEVCNSKYGNTGWLGIAQVWVSGQHITQGVVKTNDTYFATAKYNKPEWRQSVMCQEIGHTFGLAHQDENFTNAPLGSCMDYSSDPSLNQHPNQHDYDELELIYAHLDSSTTLASSPSSVAANDDVDVPPAWGRVLKRSLDGRPSLYVRDLGMGGKVFTFVIWAD